MSIKGILKIKTNPVLPNVYWLGVQDAHVRMKSGKFFPTCLGVSRQNTVFLDPWNLSDSTLSPCHCSGDFFV